MKFNFNWHRKEMVNSMQRWCVGIKVPIHSHLYLYSNCDFTTISYINVFGEYPLWFGVALVPISLVYGSFLIPR